ncbi:probable cytochrome P450 304a1 [Culex quinquefasciatus]|uniref:probable cytochrome P450 304a1 n=1 Tax=Culex quinquefasciatus TaxID=7176 RepID=UPI0018E3B450|nr:probable cytochrome P450 304a1 [Culex quinquefasciatus]
MLVTSTTLLWMVTAGLAAYYCYRFLFGRPQNFPKGPPRLPLLGGYGIMLMINYKHLHKAAAWLSNFYNTKLVGIHLASYPSILVNDYDTVKEVLTRVEFDGRPDLFLGRLREKTFERRGILLTDGPDWKEQRWFMLRYLRDFGFGRRFAELEVETDCEIRTLIEMVRYGAKYEHEGEFIAPDGSVKCPHVLFGCFANTFLYVLSGERIDRAEAAPLFEVGKHALAFLRHGDDYGTVLSLIPWIRHLFPHASNYTRLRNASMGLNAFIESVVRKHLDSYEESHVRCFLDLYFQEMKKVEPKKEGFGFQVDQLIVALADFFVAAIAGVSIQLSLLFQRLLLNPIVLSKMQAEIDNVVGHGRLPTLDDRINLPYTEATLREAMRIDTLVPSGFAHMAQQDTTLRGYDVPKGTILMLGLDAIHNQWDIWGDPEVFRPGRFLDSHGRMSLAKDVSVPFGAGKRLCAGETFSRNTMFLVVAALVQNFNLRQPGSDKKPDLGARSTGVAISPADFWLKFEPR